MSEEAQNQQNKDEQSLSREEIIHLAKIFDLLALAERELEANNKKSNDI